MPYCSEAAFAERFGSGERDALLSSDAGMLYASAAADADALVDGYIGSRYTLPLAAVPAFIVAIAADLTRYELYEEAPTKEVIERRKMAIDMLKDIRDGKILLPGATSNTPTAGIAVAASERTFSDTVLGNFMGNL